MTLEEAKRIRRYNSYIKQHCSVLTPQLEVYVEKETEKNFGRWLLDNGFFSAPASTRFHGCYEGGLFDHSFRMTQRLVWLTKNLRLQWEYPDSPVVVGMFHDLCKIDKYAKNLEKKDGEPPYVSKSGLLYSGHGMRSLALLAGHLMVSEEEAACIVYHMGAYEKDMWDEYDTAIRKFPNVLYTHTADMLASKVDGV